MGSGEIDADKLSSIGVAPRTLKFACKSAEQRVLIAGAALQVQSPERFGSKVNIQLIPHK
jgi:hypothetical protein